MTPFVCSRELEIVDLLRGLFLEGPFFHHARMPENLRCLSARDSNQDPLYSELNRANRIARFENT